MTYPQLPPKAANAVSVIETLSDANFTAHLVGGAVRDLLLELPAGDFDVATNATPEQVSELFTNTHFVGASFGVTLVNINGESIEVATWRTESSYKDGRHPDQVAYSDNLNNDAARRDFTVNALYLDSINKEVIDPVNGLADIKLKVLRAVGNPDHRFSEDGLRLLRGARLSAACGLTVCKDTEAGMKNNCEMINAVSGERIGIEFTKLLTGPKPNTGLELLKSTDVLEQVIPELLQLVDLPQPATYHPEGCVWTHTMLALESLNEPTPALAFATLFHDIGKPDTITEKDRIRFNCHAEVGSKIARIICQRLKLSNALTTRITELVKQHQHFLNVREMRPSTLKRFFRQDCFPELLALHKADRLGGNGDLEVWQWCKQKYDSFNKDQLQPTPLLTGNDLLELGIPRGTHYKIILDELESAQLDGKVSDNKEAIEFVMKKWKKLR
ncbi:MAG: CCA tRNA nucleotidyltransferase [bacterium]|nr:CCA tRNA nucleotidyltransferase [bacterium]MCP4799351.1 CCA tRNA nucleotidyltransferase [bacterium]